MVRRSLKIVEFLGMRTRIECESKGRIMKRFLLSIVILLWTTPLGAADRIRIGYSSISGAYIGLWVAHDGGYFAKEGLEDQMILIPSGTQLAQVTVAGEIDIGLLNGGSAMAANRKSTRLNSSHL